MQNTYFTVVKFHNQHLKENFNLGSASIFVKTFSIFLNTNYGTHFSKAKISLCIMHICNLLV